MQRVWAQILGGWVTNTIVLDITTDQGLFSIGFDYLIEVTNMNPQPGIGWAYDGTSFSNPNNI